MPPDMPRARTPEAGNLFDFTSPRAPTALAALAAMSSDEERFDTLVDDREVTIERIVSTGQASPPGFWYDNPRDEWVVLLAGGAALEFEGEPSIRTLRPGDYLRIPAHCRHRVVYTEFEAPDAPTVWLAVHFIAHGAAA